MIRRIDIARAPTRERLVREREVCNDIACVFLVPDFFPYCKQRKAGGSLGTRLHS